MQDQNQKDKNQKHDRRIKDYQLHYYFHHYLLYPVFILSPKMLSLSHHGFTLDSCLLCHRWSSDAATPRERWQSYLHNKRWGCHGSSFSSRQHICDDYDKIQSGCFFHLRFRSLSQARMKHERKGKEHSYICSKHTTTIKHSIAIPLKFL